MRGLGFGVTNYVGTKRELHMCLYFVCGGVGGVQTIMIFLVFLHTVHKNVIF